MLASQSSGFCFFSALLHWLKQLGFEAPDPSLFGQLVQEVSGSLVTAANSASALAAFMLAKKEGRCGCPTSLRMWGSHFKKDFAFSFSGPHVFVDEVLARVIAGSRRGFPLDAQLSIAKTFTLPVFRADAKTAGRKASSAQGSSASSASSSGFRGGGGGGEAGAWTQGGQSERLLPPGCSRSKKSPRLGFSPASKQGRGRKLSQGPCPAVIGSCLSSSGALGGRGVRSLGWWKS